MIFPARIWALQILIKFLFMPVYEHVQFTKLKNTSKFLQILGSYFYLTFSLFHKKYEILYRLSQRIFLTIFSNLAFIFAKPPPPPNFSWVMWKIHEIVKNAKKCIFHLIFSRIFWHIFSFRFILYVKMHILSFSVIWEIFNLWGHFFLQNTPCLKKSKKEPNLAFFEGHFLWI